MNTKIKNLLKIALVTVIFTSAAYAEHDNGQGKSQDGSHDKLASISVAPEPSAFWLFLTGTLAMAVYIRRDKMRNPN